MDHNELVLIGQQLGYIITDGGLCKGFSSMWIQAVCCDEENVFMQRLKLLEKYAKKPEKLAQDIANVRELLIKDEQKAKDDPNYRQKTLSDLNNEQKALLEITAFFEGIAFYLAPHKYGISEDTMHQYRDIEISKYVESVELEKLGGLQLAFRTTDEYGLTKLTNHLNAINQELQGQPNVAIEFSANNHSVTVRVVGPNQFQLVDTNHLDNMKKTYTSEELAKELLTVSFVESFLPNWFRAPKPINIATSIFTHQKNILDLEGLRDTNPIKEISPGKGLLQLAAAKNDIHTLERIDFKTVNVNQLDGLGSTALDRAAETNSVESAKLLLAVKGIDVDKSNFAIFKAITDKYYDLAYKIAEHPTFKVKKAIDLGNVLHCIAATKKPNNDTVSFAQYLIDKGADINQQNKEGNTPLYEACIQGNKQLVELFLKNNARLDVLNAKNYSVLHAAAMSGNVDLVQLFLERGLNVNQQSTTQETPLHCACRNGHKGVVEILLKLDADPNAQTAAKMTPLHYACMNGHKEIVEILLNMDANPNAPTTYEVTPLHYACAKGNKEVVELLVKNDANCNLLDHEGLRPLDFICKYNHPELLPSVLANTELSIKDIEPNSPLSKLINSCDSNVQTVFLKNALEVYIHDRKGKPEYDNFLKIGIPKGQKIAAAEALLANLNGAEQDLKSHQAALNDGHLSFLYGLYNKVLPTLQVSPEPVILNQQQSYSQMLLGGLDAIDPSSSSSKILKTENLDTSSESSEDIIILETNEEPKPEPKSEPEPEPIPSSFTPK